ncbi:MAG: NAD(P)H-dependent oxidoreductase [Paramuribaculum sp.]|nr:NAD(P)H-dependent oxidoreductase [Paramuribaculum sp.]
MITIVYCHPYDKSFNHAILNAVTKELTDNGRDYQVINLYNEHFDPVLGVNDLAVYSQGKTLDEQVKHYDEMLQRTSEIVFIFPIWWGMMPAMLKGFFDRTFLKGIIYDTTPEGALMPCLDIRRTTVITTSEEDSAIIEPFIEGYFKPLVLETVGMNEVTWFNCDHISSGTAEHRSEFLTEVLKSFAG